MNLSGSGYESGKVQDMNTAAAFPLVWWSRLPLGSVFRVGYISLEIFGTVQLFHLSICENRAYFLLWQ